MVTGLGISKVERKPALSRDSASVALEIWLFEGEVVQLLWFVPVFVSNGICANLRTSWNLNRVMGVVSHGGRYVREEVLELDKSKKLESLRKVILTSVIYSIRH